MKYSNSTKNFYPDSLAYDPASLPADLVDVTADDYTLACSRQPGETLDYQNGQLVVVPVPALTLQQTKDAKIAELSDACRAAIVAGYQSSALGAPYTYPCQNTPEHPDQQNMAASVTASMIPGLPSDWTTQFWCADANGNWAWRDHNAAQIQQAGLDGLAHVRAQQTTLATLTAQVTAATTTAAVDAITWAA